MRDTKRAFQIIDDIRNGQKDENAMLDLLDDAFCQGWRRGFGFAEPRYSDIQQIELMENDLDIWRM